MLPSARMKLKRSKKISARALVLVTTKPTVRQRTLVDTAIDFREFNHRPSFSLSLSLSLSLLRAPAPFLQSSLINSNYGRARVCLCVPLPTSHSLISCLSQGNWPHLGKIVEQVAIVSVHRPPSIFAPSNFRILAISEFSYVARMVKTRTCLFSFSIFISFIYLVRIRYIPIFAFRIFAPLNFYTLFVPRAFANAGTRLPICLPIVTK